MRTMGITITITITCALITLSPPARADDDDNVTVRIDGGKDLVLERRIYSSTDWSFATTSMGASPSDLWESVCVGTCDFKIPRLGTYRIAGTGIRASLPLDLVVHDDHAHLDVSAAFASGWAGAITMVVLGPLVMVGGTGAFLLSSNRPEFDVPPCTSDSPCNGPPPQSHGAVIASALTIGVGAAMLIGGMIGLVASRHSIVHQMAALGPRSLVIKF